MPAKNREEVCPRITRMSANGSDRIFIHAHSRYSRANLFQKHRLKRDSKHQSIFPVKSARLTTISSITDVLVAGSLTPLTTIENTSSSPAAVRTYPDRAETWSIVPVFPRTFPEALVPLNRFRKVPST